MIATVEEKFVVLHMGIGRDFTNGQVVTRKELEDLKASVDRLLAKKAIRRATHFEMGETKVAFKDIDRPSHHHDINELQETINHKNKRISELENELAIMGQQLSNVQRSAPPQSVQQLLLAKEKLIRELQVRVNELKDELATERKNSAEIASTLAKHSESVEFGSLGATNQPEEYDPLG